MLLRARSGLFGLAVTLLIAGCADGGEAQRRAIQVRLVTPIPATATPTRVPEPTATATPVEEPELVLSVTEVFQGGRSWSRSREGWRRGRRSSSGAATG